MPSYTYTHDVTKPAGSRDVSLGDDDIREMKLAYDERLNEEHVKPNDETGVTTVGYHRKATLINQASNPTQVADAVILFTKDVSTKSEIHCIDEDGNAQQLTSAGKWRAENLSGVYPAANYAAVATLMGFIYPVGCVYTTTVSTNPGTLFGFGTWAAFGAGQVMVGLDAAQTEFDTAEETGGAKTHTLTSAEMPAHTHSHSLSTVNNNSSAGTAGAAVEGQSTNDSIATTTGSTGDGGAHNNLQPYVVVYFWKRVS